MLLASIIGLGATYGIAYVAGHSTYPYKKVYWIFEASHFLAGAFVAMFLATFFTNPWQIVCLTIGIGFVWELVEYGFWISPWRRKFMFKGTMTLPDTLLDLALDALGAVAFIALLLPYLT